MSTEDVHAESPRAEDTITSGGDLPGMSGIADMLRIMIEDRERREREFAEERERREKQRGEEMRTQMEMLQRLISERPTVVPRASGEGESMKLTKLTESDDIEAYLTTFERMMEAYEVGRARWTFKLAPQLTGKAQQAYAALPPDDAKDYDTVRAAILRRYNISEETYRRRFRAPKPKEGETPRELVTRLNDLFSRWTKDCSSREEIQDMMVKEQLLNMLPEDVRLWVYERKPKTSAEAGELAEDYMQAREQSSKQVKPVKKDKPPGKCPRCGMYGHWASDCPNPKAKRDGPGPTGDQKPSFIERVKCFNCSQRGHFASSCPQKALYCDTGREQGRREQDRAYRRGTINGVYCRDILVDTGASKTLVRGDLVTEDDIVDGEVTIRCAHGDTLSYPLAIVKISIGGKDMIIQAAVSDSLPAAALLGWDIPELMELVVERDSTTKPEQTEPSTALAVLTRQQEKDRDRQGAPQTDDPRVQQTAVDVAEPSDTDSDDEARYPFDFDDSFFPSTEQQRERLTRSQKRNIRRRHNEETTASTTSPMEISSEELRTLQENDETLEAARRAADGEVNAAGEGFFRRDGLLYRRWSPQGSDGDEAQIVEQLVLPVQCRQPVVRLAHDIPMAGHLGKRKTADRIRQRFYWPSLYRDVAKYCQSCERCQKSSPRHTLKAPLVPLPIMETPFQRIAMDIVGPLPRSSSGKRFILVICDYATRYPEAIPLRNIDANTVAEELMKFFARVGVPSEILTDQGTNFTSQLLAEVYRLLHVKPIRTTPYHPQTDGLVERFNQTLKAMLRKTAEEGKDWDRLIPYLLFAYREVPQASTGFSPFELLYGRQVRGPLDIIKETWEASNKSTESVVSYVLSIQERLAKLREIVRENLQSAQSNQKTWYDRHARHREFKPGEEVLVLLPTSTQKLLAEWQGPFSVTRRVGEACYEIKMTGRRKPERIFHVNMLRKWHSPTAVSFFAEEINDDISDDTDDVVTWSRNDTDESAPLLGEHLNSTQIEDIQNIWQEFSNVLRSDPGRTTVTEHRIDTGEASPVRLPPYRIPHAYREIVREELAQMEKDGIIERSASEWAAPIVLVKKKDGTIRMCVDYRRLNSLSHVDAYPMPRVDDLIDRLGDAKYISTFDLSRGYWQVPVRESDQPKTAFTTPYGLFQFRVMPFGLQGAPATFQRMMDILLADAGEFAAAYLDDVVIHSANWDDHLRHVREVLQRLERAGLTIKPKKCQFAMSQCTYLGHVVGNGEVRPEMSKVRAVESFPTPKTKKQVRAFLGLTGYYRKFIAGYADIAMALTDLTRKNAPNTVVWTTACEKAFEALKKALCSTAVLQSPDFNRPFILQTDASNRGVGAVLSQRDDDGNERPIAYYSRKLLPREERYSTVEKECLAIKVATNTFRVYLLGKPFVIQTDHRSLEWLDRLKDNNARLTRWSLALQPYNFKVQYRSGKTNTNADALSRAYFSFDDTTSSQGKGGGM